LKLKSNIHGSPYRPDPKVRSKRVRYASLDWPDVAHGWTISSIDPTVGKQKVVRFLLSCPSSVQFNLFAASLVCTRQLSAGDPGEVRSRLSSPDLYRL